MTKKSIISALQWHVELKRWRWKGKDFWPLQGKNSNLILTQNRFLDNNIYLNAWEDGYDEILHNNIQNDSIQQTKGNYRNYLF